MFLLYVLPIVVRFVVTPPTDVGDTLLSLLPLAIVLPAKWFERWFSDPRREHVARHALYAVAFAVSAGACVRWDVIVSQRLWSLFAYLTVGTVTLGWFVLSHVVENAWDETLRTHQGDVTVLPLTLVAIATFAFDVPDAAFRYSRSVIFYVPVVVAWATIHFIAYTGFARSTDTTYDHPSFTPRSMDALIVAMAHLTLLEVRAGSIFFQFFPLVAAVLSQVSSVHACRPRQSGRMATLVVAAALGCGVGALLSTHFARIPSYTLGVYLTTTFGLATTATTATRWPLPAALYSSLLTTATFSSIASGVDSVAIAAVYFVAFWLLRFLAPGSVPSVPTSTMRERAMVRDRPQERTLVSIPALMRGLCGVGCGCGESAERVLRKFGPSDPSCPTAFEGVWWMDGNGFPMECVSVGEAKWVDGRTSLRSARMLSFEATLGGLILYFTNSVKVYEVEMMEHGWIRTTVRWCGFLLPSTYWLLPLDENEMIRVVFDEAGQVMWRYRMRRIIRKGVRTVHYAEYATLSKRYF